MVLFHRQFGEGPALIIAHGLYGSSDNWVTIGRELSRYFEVFIIDQRNHGQSPHSNVHTYEAMKEDLREFMDDNGLDSAILTGHSMGGKTVMLFAADYPDRVNGLIVIDMAPGSYQLPSRQNRITADHESILSGLLRLNLKQYHERKAVEEAMSSFIPSPDIRQFLLKNLRRSADNTFTWKINLAALHHNLDKILGGINIPPFEKRDQGTGFPVLFIRGEFSGYITSVDEEEIHQIFPNAEIKTIPRAGHWVHAEQPQLLLKMITDFIL